MPLFNNFESFQFLKEIAITNNAKLISKKWLGVISYYNFRLKDKKEIKIKYDYLKKNGWPKNIESYIKNQYGQQKSNEKKLNELQEAANKRGGRLISTEWINVNQKYEFETCLGERFFSLPSTIKSGKWKRDGLITEPLCRQVLEHMFGFKFPTTQRVLTAKILGRMRPLELDGYCEELNIAFEYQGHKSHWYSNHPSYQIVAERDKIKKKFCKKLGILLIIIDRIPDNKIGMWESDNIFLHVLKSVKKSYRLNKINLPNLKLDGFQADLTKNSHAYKKLKELEEIAVKNKGKLICNVWKGARARHRFIFEDGREFEIIPDSLKRYGWPKDPDFFLKTSEDRLNDFKKLAEINGAIVMEKKWLGCETKHKVKFSNGKIYEIVPQVASYNGWNQDPERYCKKDEDKFKDLQKLAKKNKGELLEKKWLGHNKKHKFRYIDGTIIYKAPFELRINGWPKDLVSYHRYSRTDEENLQIIREIAEKNNGKLISTKWIDVTAKYEFAFASGNKFWLTAHKLKTRGWPKNENLYFIKLETDEEKYTKLKNMGKEKKIKLLEKKWLGYKHKYSFELKNKKVVLFTYGRLRALGFPKYIDE